MNFVPVTPKFCRRVCAGRVTRWALPPISSLFCTALYCGFAWSCEGNFSCLAAVFRLRRNVGYFVLQSYIPSILIVMISWVGFCISRNSDPARVSLGVTTVLTMTTIAKSSSQVFVVSYLVALDVWCATCMVFVFGALLEYAVVSVVVRRERKVAESLARASIELVLHTHIHIQWLQCLPTPTAVTGVWFTATFVCVFVFQFSVTI